MESTETFVGVDTYYRVQVFNFLERTWELRHGYRFATIGQARSAAQDGDRIVQVTEVSEVIL